MTPGTIFSNITSIMMLENIALFPIPGSVSLPFDKVPLHIFEPRYRQMVQDSIAAGRRIGVAHTQYLISSSKVSPSATRDEILNSNHATYQAQPVFSAGFARIIETLNDGRLLVEIEMDSRYEMIRELQEKPYTIASCRLFKDEFEEPDASLRADADRLLVLCAGEHADQIKEVLAEPEWQNLSLFEYSFKIFSLVRLEPDLLQKILELRSTSARIQFLKQILTPPVYN